MKLDRFEGENYFRQFIKVNKKNYILDAEFLSLYFSYLFSTLVLILLKRLL